MIEIYNNLFIGNEIDYEDNVKYQENWKIIHACKEPYHRMALGYTGRAALNTHPEYLFAYRENKLILNIVDVDDYKYISDIIIDEAIRFIDENIQRKKILVHCNQGQSRSAGIGLLYLAHIGKFIGKNFKTSELEYINIYPQCNMKKGIRDFIELNWDKYCKS